MWNGDDGINSFGFTHAINLIPGPSHKPHDPLAACCALINLRNTDYGTLGQVLSLRFVDVLAADVPAERTAVTCLDFVSTHTGLYKTVDRNAGPS
jgi:hypothetical protein